MFFYDLLGMIQQLGTHTWFVTLSAADMRCQKLFKLLFDSVAQCIQEDVPKLTFEEKCKWIRQNPVTTARHFHYRLTTF